MYTERKWALALFRGMAERGLRRPHATQACLDITDDDEVLSALKSSGCIALLVGFESVSEKSLRVMRKGVNLKVGVSHYRDRVSRVHDHGLVVFGSFMFGNDGDDPDIFDRTAEFVMEAGVDLAYFGLLTPYPGTDLHKRLGAEGRLLFTNFPADYARYDMSTAVFRPKGMEPEELEEGLVRAARMVGSRRAVTRRTWDTLRTTKDPLLATLVYRWNRSGFYQRIVEWPGQETPATITGA
jgi:radical SAM superfamily enzyme YgiQ (UPF0313 family)